MFHVCKTQSVDLSYDDNVTIWDTRSMKNSLVSFNTGGGVFRVKWHPYQPGLLACACMYNGYTLLEFEDGMGSMFTSFMVTRLKILEPLALHPVCTTMVIYATVLIGSVQPTNQLVISLYAALFTIIVVAFFRTLPERKET